MITFRGITTLTQAASTTVTLIAPPGVVAGDLLLAVLHVGGGTGTTITPPAGWELALRTNDGVNQATAVYRRRALPDLPPSHSFTITSAACVAAMLAYGGADQASPIDAAGGQANASSASATAPGVTTTKSNALLVGLWGAASGAPTATPPAGFTERLDLAGSALALSAADNVQGTLGTSGTRVATLSSASPNIGTLLALAPSALNTPAAVRDEGNWPLHGWTPRITTEAAMDAFVEGLIQRANVQLRLRVGADFYGANVLADPYSGLLKEAEMHLAQALLLDAAAQITEAGDESNPTPFPGTGADLRALAAARRAQAEEIFRTTRGAGRPGPQGPSFAGALSTAPVRDLFDPTTGLS